MLGRDGGPVDLPAKSLPVNFPGGVPGTS
jgi:hypothetical protein